MIVLGVAGQGAGGGAQVELAYLKARILACGSLLGLLQSTPDEFFGRGVRVEPRAGHVTITGFAPTVSVTEAAPLRNELIDAMIQERLAARKAKNWAEADRIRKDLAEQGILLEDGPKGTTWRRA